MKVLFVGMGFPAAGASKLSSFQRVDLELLTSYGYDVRSLIWTPGASVRLLRAAGWADLVYCWYISYHALQASLRAKKLACAIGGFEFARIPECHYGNMVKRRMRFVTRWVWRNADALLYVDRSLMDEARAAFGGPGRGEYVPFGYDSEYWSPGEGPKRDIVLTVCPSPTRDRARRKGVDVFLEVAHRNPDLQFHLVGDISRVFPEYASLPNLTMYPFLRWNDLRELYRSAKVYCQLSIHEGLPNALCEAMLCGCVPVGTAANGIPTAIGDAGFIVSREPDEVAAAIRRALAEERLGGRARARISEEFPIARRRRELREALERVVAEAS